MTRTLAQLGDWINPDIPALPGPPLFQRLVLEAPTLPAVALLVAGVVVLIAMRSRAQLKAGLVALGVAFLFAAGIWTTGSLVETERETLLVLQDRLIDATAHARVDELEPLLARNARARSGRLPQLRGGLDRAQILTTIENTLGRAYAVDSTAVIERQAVIDGPNAARTQVYLSVQPEDYNKTWAWFAIDWRLEPDGRWRAIEIEPLFISGVLTYGP